MYGRRDLLKLGLGGALAGLGEMAARAATAQAAPALADPINFTPDLVADMARDLAKRPYAAPSADLPEPFASLTYDQYVGIRLKTEATIWGSERTGFAIEPLHRGFIFASPMELHLVDGGVARRLVYEASHYDFGRVEVPPNMPDIGFSGFRLLQSREGSGLSEVAIFQGASFFRALARGQNLGVMARALSIRTADPKGEEFPLFRAIFLEKPSLATNAFIAHALLDSQSVTGAYRFTLRPGEATIIDTELTLFPRVEIDHFGLGPMQATYLFGPIDRRRADDVRPGVYEVTGLQILNGNGEWLWRPVANRETLQVSAFLGENPRGFGMLQRDRAFESFEDDEQHWERRPSLWIEPIDDWGAGMVDLVEIPSESEVNDNIVGYWRPKQNLTPGTEARFAYRQFWCWSPPERTALSEVRATFSGHGSSAKRRRFIVEFAGEIFADPQRTADVTPMLNAAPGTIIAIHPYLSHARKTYRVAFEIDPGSDNYSELRLVLESAGKPISETWLYRWTP
ncbi:MAG: glucan biosynthesis protein [Methylobacteriaceae bacterium]|nr:glucan biosynthesis protein [Methylobacteriaceae bacterium]MBV9220444.1 glucan biosynthesis protein [Methylobacteriaceae bacterium]MBV9244000.1 glucan biosynthesis protein [Methylobacteriaceae bacterium]MBV9636488.1 glucan biosynthesis protein [Methylobacteriaceae bacterium]